MASTKNNRKHLEIQLKSVRHRLAPVFIICRINFKYPPRIALFVDDGCFASERAGRRPWKNRSGG